MTISSRDDLISAKKAYRAGDAAVLTVSRSGEVLQLSITFDEEIPVLDNGSSQQSAPGYGFGFDPGKGQ